MKRIIQGIVLGLFLVNLNLLFAITFDELRDIQKQCVVYELSKKITNKLILLTTRFECDYDPLPYPNFRESGERQSLTISDFYVSHIRYLMDIKGYSANSKLDFICFQNVNKFKGFLHGHMTYDFPMMLDNGALYITFVEEYKSVDNLRMFSCYTDIQLKQFEVVMKNRKFYNAASTLFMSIDVPIEVGIPHKFCSKCNKTHKFIGKRKSDHNFFINNDELSDFLFLMKKYDKDYSQEQYESVLKVFGLNGISEAKTEFGMLLEQFIVGPPNESTRVYKIRSKAFK